MRSCALDVVDFHSHILPCADHGSYSIKTSILQIGFAKKNSVSRIIATPHFYPHMHTLKVFLNMRTASANTLNSYTIEEDAPAVKLGAEVLLCEGLEKFSGLPELCLQGTNTILLELPFVEFHKEYVKTTLRLMDKGYDVILAHADRYRKDNIQKFLDSGVKKLQLNASSLVGPIRRKHLFDWAASGYVVAIGSDIHGSDKNAYKRFSKVLKKSNPDISYIKKRSDEIWDKMT